MRIVSPSLALGVALLAGLSGSSLLAQDQSQPASGATAQAPQAQQQENHHANPRHQARRLAKELGLSADQESKLEPILADRAQQMQALHADSTVAPQDAQAKAKGIRQDSNAKIEALLTDTQKQQFERMKATRKAKKMQQSSTATS